MLKRTWTDEKLIEIMNDFPKSWANVCRKLGLKVLNSNRKNIKKRCEELGLPTEIVWRYSYTKNELREAVENSGSYRQVLMAVGVSPHGGGYE